jgi:citrate lyase beta subunit
VAHGLIGKTAIHPSQAEVIERQYRVTRDEWEMAERILDPSAPAVFRMHNAMCEPSTHAFWARTIRARRDIFGLAED